MWWLYFFINFTIYATLGTLASVLAPLLPSKSGTVNENVLVSVQYTSQGKHKCWPGWIQTLHMDKLWRKKLGHWQKEGIHGSCQWCHYPWKGWSTCLAWTPNTNVKGRERPPIVRGCRTLHILWSCVGPLLRTCFSLQTPLMSLSFSITCLSQCSRPTLHPTALTPANFLYGRAIV